jgi:hypothetical protein
MTDLTPIQGMLIGFGFAGAVFAIGLGSATSWDWWLAQKAKREAERHARETAICADTGAQKNPLGCWNVRCQLGGTCCRAGNAGVPDTEGGR